MGGGDLNMKKSWHPQTMRNIERVWKVEQKHEGERKKIEELQKELADERAREEIQRHAEDTGVMRKKSERLDWMYSGVSSMVDREAYLLGKPIDRYANEKLAADEPGPCEKLLFSEAMCGDPMANTVVDIAVKIREDPLFLIRKKEEERKREMLKNPIKMKKIKEMLKKNLAEEEKKRKKMKKKKKKQRHHSSSDHSCDEPGVNNGRSKQRQSLEVKPERLQHKTRHGVYRFQRQGCLEDPPEHRYRSHSPRSPTRRDSLVKEEDSLSQHNPGALGRYREKQTLAVRGNSQGYRRPVSGWSRKLPSEELERLRQDMEANAKWRDKQRVENIVKYKKEDENEAQKEKSDKYDGKYFRAMKLESATSSSLEDRVKRNMHNIQRTSAEINKNFMQR
uniref:pre-mRNA-splicing factor CWC25 homolog n=1 Tax=Myxine glutinosa TaxID=7769 RepID=UPI00358E000B